jgi:UDP-glucose 4-epimerase
MWAAYAGGTGIGWAKMKVLLTGAAGYVGWSVVNALVRCEAIDEVIVYDNFSRRNYGLLLTKKCPEYEKLVIKVDDILNSRGLREAVKDAACVCHLAALAPSPFADENPHAFDQINHWGTAEVCYAAEDQAVPRIVYVSSGAVYGFGTRAFDADSDPRPATSYGASKLAGEKHVERLAGSRQAVILRSATVYGLNPVARFDTFLNKFALDVALGRPLQVHGSGEQRRPIIHVETLAAVVAATVQGKIDTGIYNAVDENISINEAISALRIHVPNLDAIFLSQQERLRDLMMERDSKLESTQFRQHKFENEIGNILAGISLS